MCLAEYSKDIFMKHEDFSNKLLKIHYTIKNNTLIL